MAIGEREKGTIDERSAPSSCAGVSSGQGRAHVRLSRGRQLLNGSSDLTQDIQNLINGGTTTGSVDLPNVTLGSFFSSGDVTVSFQNLTQQGSNWSGSVSIAAGSASLALGQAFSAQIQGNAQNSVGLSGTYTLNNQPLGQGAYAITATELNVTASNLLTGTASNVEIDYSPSAAPGQKLAHIGSLTASLTPFANASATLTNLDVYDNGFALENGSINAGPFTLGSILTVTNPSLTFSGVGDIVGSSPTGTIALGAGLRSFSPARPRSPR